MKPVTLASTTQPTAALVTRWMRLIESHGGATAAVDALLRDSDRLQALQDALLQCGIDPDQLLQDFEARRQARRG